MGLLIKGGAYLEALARPALIAFDKTGTLTLGKLTLVRWIGDESLKPHVKALEAQSSHPVARALVRALKDAPSLSASSFEQHTGHGVEGTVEGRRIGVGAARTAQQPLPAWAKDGLRQLDAEGLSAVVVTVDGDARAICGLGDPLRPDAASTLLRLTSSGHRLALLSGDRQAVVDALVAKLERESGREGLFACALGDQAPEAKLAWVERESGRGQVFMVGDGVNDAAALAAATVGIAVHGGAEASVSAAHVFSTREGVAPVYLLLEGAGRALRVIHENLAFSFAYNVLAAGLTLAGAISPLWAAVIMPLSSLTVVSHSYSRKMFREAP
jgi:P-type E1-E2 ATPase